MSQECRFLEEEKLICREFYDFYRKHRRKVAKGIDQYKLFEKAIAGLTTAIRNTAEQTEGGVDIKGFAYFCHIKDENKRVNPTEKSFFKRRIKKYYYHYWFFPEEWLKGWYIELNNNVPDYYKREHKLQFEAIQSHYDAVRFNKQVNKFSRNNLKY